MYRVYYFGFYDNSSTGVNVLPPFRKARNLSFTTLAKTTITKDDHDKAGGNHTYI
jgi:hypothetical protein